MISICKYYTHIHALEFLLRQAGFIRVERSSCGVSREPGMAIDQVARAHESLYVEASKPAKT